MATRAQKEQELVNKYFNGNYSDAEWDCTCSGNTKPSAVRTPITTPSPPRTPTPVVTNPVQTVTPVNPNTGTVGDNTGNQGNNQNPVTNPGTTPTNPSPTNPEYNSPTFDQNLNDALNDNGILPSNPGSPISQTGSGTVQDVNTPEKSNAGVWLLGLVLAGIAIRQVTKNKGNKPLKVKL